MADAATHEAGYRPRRYYLGVGVVTLIGFLTFGIGSTAVAWWNVDGSFPNPKLAALVFASFWSVMSGVSVWIILAYYRERLLLDKQAVTQYGIIGTKRIPLPEVRRLKWRPIPVGGSIVIRSLGDKVKVYLNNFTAEERAEIVAFVRQSFSLDIQEGWDRFQTLQTRHTAPPPPTSRGGLAVVATVWAAFSGAYVFCWQRGLGIRYLVLGVCCAIMSAWFLWRLKNVQRKRTEPSDGETASSGRAT